MVTRLLIVILLLLLSVWVIAQPRTYTIAESQAAWNRLQRQPITEATFRQACDLIQDIGQTNLQVAYDLLAQYVPKVRKMGNQKWLHILLINWGKGYESLSHFSEAEPIFREARQNAKSDPLLFGQAIVYTTLLYLDWEKSDSIAHYIAIGEKIARRVNDRETLSFLHTFRALSNLRKGQPEIVLRDFNEAIRLATGLPDKNALFMAQFNRTVYYLTNPQQQVAAFDTLLTLTNDSTLSHKPRFYERTTFYFRNPRPTVLYNLVQLNLLLADYENAGRFADMVYDALVRPNPNGPSAPHLNAEMSFVKSQQGNFTEARSFLTISRRQFGINEANILYPTYFISAGLLAEHEGQFAKAADYYLQAIKKGLTTAAFSRMPPELFYVRALLHTGQYGTASRMLAKFEPDVATNRYTTLGLYYFQALANLRKAQNDLPGYSKAIDSYHTIQDSLTNLNQYRAVQQIMARVQLREKEQQISRLNAENEARLAQLRRERLFYGIILALAGLVIGLLIVYMRNRQIRAQQREQLQESQFEQREQQRQIELMQRVMEAEESERRSIADQLHNEVNPLLAVATLNVSSALEATAPENTMPKLHKAQSVLNTISSTVRGISHRLTPQLIEQYGFRKAIDELIEGINMAGKVRLRTIIIGFDDELPMPFLSDLYRIVQELVHNVIRHAQATEATVELIEHDQHITILVEDNGIGINNVLAGDGQGLQTIRAKVALRHGQMDVQRKPEGGTLIVIDHLQVPEAITQPIS